MLSPRSLPAYLSRRSHYRREELAVLELHQAEDVASLLDSAIQTQNWTIVNLCRDRLRSFAALKRRQAMQQGS
jgi:hypothetical protein